MYEFDINIRNRGNILGDRRTGYNKRKRIQ